MLRTPGRVADVLHQLMRILIKSISKSNAESERFTISAGALR